MCLGNSSHILFCHHDISGHFPRWPLKKLVGTISYYPLNGFHSNFIGGSLGISEGGSLCIFGKNSLKTRWLTEDILKKCPRKKLVGAISYIPLAGSHSNLMLWFAGYFG